MGNQHRAPLISTPIVQQQQQQQRFLPPYFQHSLLNNTSTSSTRLAATPYATTNSYQQQQQPPFITPPLVIPQTTRQYSTNTDNLELDVTYTVANSDRSNDNNTTNKSKLDDLRNNDNVATRIPANLDFGDFSMDSGARFTKNHLEENVHGTLSPVLVTDYPPPDLISNNLEFKRTMRKWVSAKEKDDDFFEEEQRYLKSLQAKRLK